MPVGLPQRRVRLRVLGIESKRTIKVGNCVIDVLGFVILEQVSPAPQVLIVGRIWQRCPRLPPRQRGFTKPRHAGEFGASHSITDADISNLARGQLTAMSTDCFMTQPFGLFIGELRATVRAGSNRHDDG